LLGLGSRVLSTVGGDDEDVMEVTEDEIESD